MGEAGIQQVAVEQGLMMPIRHAPGGEARVLLIVNRVYGFGFRGFPNLRLVTAGRGRGGLRW